MNTVLWILQWLLAFVFLGAGAMKLMRSKSELEPQMGWVNDFSESQVKTIGALEVAGALGLVLPALLDIAPILTPLAAIGLALVMLGAVAVHVRRNETVPYAVVTAVLAALAAFVAYGRIGPESF